MADENLVYDIRYTSAVPGRIAGEDRAHELTAMDLAMKFHQIRGLYFFSSAAAQGMLANDFKNPMSQWLIPYFNVCGRIRISKMGRPFIKPNDAGVRIIEARSSRTIDEWLAMKDGSLDDKLIYIDAHGDELGFTPLVYIQITWFKCGGISMGLSWAHVLGDVFSASAFMNGLTQFLQDQHPPKPLMMPDPTEPRCCRSIAAKAHSLKRVNPVGNTWATATSCKMAKHTFHFTSKQLDQINSSIIQAPDPEVRSFELILAIIWKSIANIRKNSAKEPKIVTICKNKIKSKDRKTMIPHNGLEISIIEVKYSIVEADIMKLATSVVNETTKENAKIEEIVEEEPAEAKKSDYIIYGARLTFLDMEEANIYDLKVKGQSPILVNYNIGGVSEEGAVLIFSGPKFHQKEGNDGMLAATTLPENELEQLRNMLNQEWGII